MQGPEVQKPRDPFGCGKEVFRHGMPDVRREEEAGPGPQVKTKSILPRVKMGLLQNVDPFRVIKAALGQGGEYADIYIEETANTSIVAEEKRIEKVITGRDRGAGIRVIANLKTYFAYTNDTSEKGLLEVAAVVAKGVQKGQPAGDINLTKKDIAPRFDIKRPPAGASVDEKVALVNRGEKTAWGFDARIRQGRVVYGDGARKVAIVTSLGEWVEGERNSLLFLGDPLSPEGHSIQTGYEPLG